MSSAAAISTLKITFLTTKKQQIVLQALQSHSSTAGLCWETLTLWQELNSVPELH